MPPTRVRDLKRERRPQCFASDELVAPGTAVNAEVALVHEPDDCPGIERDLHDCAPILVTEIVMNELHVVSFVRECYVRRARRYCSRASPHAAFAGRSEEHTSELQS